MTSPVSQRELLAEVGSLKAHIKILHEIMNHSGEIDTHWVVKLPTEAGFKSGADSMEELYELIVKEHRAALKEIKRLRKALATGKPYPSGHEAEGGPAAGTLPAGGAAGGPPSAQGASGDPGGDGEAAGRPRQRDQGTKG